MPDRIYPSQNLRKNTPQAGAFVFATIGLILILALSLRLYQLSVDSLWEDEIFTATQASLPWPELVEWTAGDIHPPGYYLLVGQVARWAGWTLQHPSQVSDWLWRFPSALAGTLAVAVAYRLGLEWTNRRAAQVGALLLAVSPVAVQYSQEARMHELFLLISVFSTWALARAMAGVESGPSIGTRRAWWVVYAVATALNLYTVYLAFVVLVAQAGWVAAVCLKRYLQKRQPGSDASTKIFYCGEVLVPWFASVLAAFVLYLPWWPVLLGMAAQKATPGATTVDLGTPLAFFVKAIDSLGPGTGWPAWLFLGVWLFGILDMSRRRPTVAVFGVLWLLLPLALPLVYRDPRALHMRYAFLLPVYLLFVGQGAIVLGKTLARLARLLPVLRSPLAGPAQDKTFLPGGENRLTTDSAPLLVVTGTCLICFYFLAGYYLQIKPDWRGVGVYLEDRTAPGDVIVTGPLFDVGRYLDYYYAGPAEIVTPAVLVDTLPSRVKSMRISGGRVWAVTHFRPASMPAVQLVEFSDLIVSEPLVAIYEPEVLTAVMIDLMQQAVEAAPAWARQMSAGGIMDPDPAVTQAAAYLFLGDVYRVAGRLPEAIAAYEAMVNCHPASAGGYITLAETYLAAGRTREAAFAYQKAVGKTPGRRSDLENEAALLMDAGKWREAAKIYQTIINQGRANK